MGLNCHRPLLFLLFIATPSVRITNSLYTFSMRIHPVSFYLVVIIAIGFASLVQAQQDKCSGERHHLLETVNPDLRCALVLDDDLIFPRNIFTRENEIWLVDKGSHLFLNGENNGAIYRYSLEESGYERTKVLDNLDDPNDIDIRPDKNGDDWIYFTTRSSVKRFKVISDDFESMPETLISMIPTQGWHKLAAIHLTKNSLYLTVPSLTDHCEVNGRFGVVENPCVEIENAALIRKYDFHEDALSAEFTLVAKGLRDALAVQTNPDETKLIAADNGWDQIDLSLVGLSYDETPHDEINIIDLSKAEHFGWPYCYDQDSISPPYRLFVDDCDQYRSPDVLLPAHSAPLGMLYFDDELLVNLHGPNIAGGRTISFEIDGGGVPQLDFKIKVNWHFSDGTLGRPKGLASSEGNVLLVTDDWNHQLIKIVFND